MIARDRSHEWAAAGARLRGFLRSRGASPWLAEDLAQETLLRAVTHEIGFADADDLLRWCVPVARNLLVDDARRATRCGDAEVPDAPSHVDVEREVLARLELSAVQRHLPSLSAADRAVILSAVEGAPTPTERKAAVSEAVRRHRARQRLSRLVAGAAAVWGWAWARRPRSSTAVLAVAMPALTMSAWYQAPSLDPWSEPGRGAAVRVAVAGGTSSLTPAPALAVLRSAAARAVPAPGDLRGQEAPVRPVVHRAVAGQELTVRDVPRPAPGAVVCLEGFDPVPDSCLGLPHPAVAPVSASATVSGPTADHPTRLR